MSTGDPNYYSPLVTDNTAGTITTGSYYYDESLPNIDDWGYKPYVYPTPLVYTNPYINKNKGDNNMRYLYEVILVNPEDEEFEIGNVIAGSETAALMIAYNDSKFSDKESFVDFDDLKTKCRVIMEWKKEKSLEKALETIKKAVE